MNTEKNPTPFYRPMLSAVFAGILATLVCLAYDIIYRDETGFSLSGFINVSSIIFIVNIIFLIAGVLYAVLVGSSRRADLLFRIAFAVLILLCIWGAMGVQRSPIHEETVQFRGLLVGILIIIGAGMVAIPYLFHNRRFEHEILD